MSSVPESIIPDAVDPVIGYRSWGYRNGLIFSQAGGKEWQPGEPHEAECQVCQMPYWKWAAVEGGGHSLEEILSTRKKFPSQAMPVQAWSASTAIAPGQMYSVNEGGNHGPAHEPNVSLPEGWGYQAEIVETGNISPMEHCACGLYASAIENGHPVNDVWGEVYLWGKTIKGSAAHRAQYAYPKTLNVTVPELVEKLEAYGVPVKVVKSPFRSEAEAHTFALQPGGLYPGTTNGYASYTATKATTVTIPATEAQTYQLANGDSLNYTFNWTFE